MGRAAEMGSLIQTVITEPRSHGQDGCCCPAQARPRTHFPAIAASNVETCNPSFDRGPTEGFTVTSPGYWLRAGCCKKRLSLQVARVICMLAVGMAGGEERCCTGQIMQMMTP